LQSFWQTSFWSTRGDFTGKQCRAKEEAAGRRRSKVAKS